MSSTIQCIPSSSAKWTHIQSFGKRSESYSFAAFYSIRTCELSVSPVYCLTSLLLLISPISGVLSTPLRSTPTVIIQGMATQETGRLSTFSPLNGLQTAQLISIYPFRYLTPYQTPTMFNPPSSAGTDVVFNTPNWSGSHLSLASDLSTPSLTFDSYSSSSSASHSPSEHGRRRTLISSRPQSAFSALPHVSRPATRRGSIAAATPYDRHGHSTIYAEEASGVRARRRQSFSTEKDKEKERTRARAHRENEQRVLLELSMRLPPPTLGGKRSRVEVMTDGMSPSVRNPYLSVCLYGGTDLWLIVYSNDTDR